MASNPLTESRNSWYLSLVDRAGKPRYDVFPIFANPQAFRDLLEDITNHFQTISYDKIVAIDAIGFCLGGALAVKTEKSFIPIRKRGKLPFEDLETREIVDWDGKKGLEMKKEWISKDDKVLLVDEWIGEGFQISAAIDMIETLGGTVVGVASIYLHPDFDQNIELVQKYPTFAANCLVYHVDGGFGLFSSVDDLYIKQLVCYWFQGSTVCATRLGIPDLCLIPNASFLNLELVKSEAFVNDPMVPEKAKTLQLHKVDTENRSLAKLPVGNTYLMR